VRLPKNDFLIKMIRSINAPLASTSCNLSGEPEVGNLREIISLFKKQKYQPDFVVSYNKARPRKKPSKIIDIRNINNIKLIRF
jgi:tRNA A37 threonylcarbamoyladenosine synthetase subunit TsaC/SUA5/YrdC